MQKSNIKFCLYILKRFLKSKINKNNIVSKFYDFKESNFFPKTLIKTYKMSSLILVKDKINLIISRIRKFLKLRLSNTNSFSKNQQHLVTKFKNNLMINQIFFTKIIELNIMTINDKVELIINNFRKFMSRGKLKNNNLNFFISSSEYSTQNLSLEIPRFTELIKCNSPKCIVKTIKLNPKIKTSFLQKKWKFSSICYKYASIFFQFIYRKSLKKSLLKLNGVTIGKSNCSRLNRFANTIQSNFTKYFQKSQSRISSALTLGKQGHASKLTVEDRIKSFYISSKTTKLNVLSYKAKCFKIMKIMKLLVLGITRQHKLTIKTEKENITEMSFDKKLSEGNLNFSYSFDLKNNSLNVTFIIN